MLNSDKEKMRQSNCGNKLNIFYEIFKIVFWIKLFSNLTLAVMEFEKLC